ncbi:MAG: phosphotransferase [Microbacterium sp.]
MSIPTPDVPVPGRVRALARGAAVSPVWVNGIGGVTFRADDGRYIKVGPLHRETSMSAEAERLRWAAPYTAVPDVLEVGDCPFDWSVRTRIGNAAARGIHVPGALRSPPPIDALVVCHGDACAPNTLLDAEGRPLAHVDLGALGVADRWADIAVAAMSTTWNYGPGWEHALIDAYGIAADEPRMAYYRDLWNAT